MSGKLTNSEEVWPPLTSFGQWTSSGTFVPASYSCVFARGKANPWSAVTMKIVLSSSPAFCNSWIRFPIRVSMAITSS